MLRVHTTSNEQRTNEERARQFKKTVRIHPIGGDMANYFIKVEPIPSKQIMAEKHRIAKRR